MFEYSVDIDFGRLTLPRVKELLRTSVSFERPKYSNVGDAVLIMAGKTEHGDTIELKFWSPTRSPYSHRYHYSLVLQNEFHISGRLHNFALVFPDIFESHLLVWANLMVDAEIEGFMDRSEMIPSYHFWRKLVN